MSGDDVMKAQVSEVKATQIDDVKKTEDVDEQLSRLLRETHCWEMRRGGANFWAREICLHINR